MCIRDSLITGGADSNTIFRFGRGDQISTDNEGKANHAPILNSIIAFTDLPVTGPIDVHLWASQSGFGSTGSPPSSSLAMRRVYNGSVTLDDWKDLGGSPAVKACTMSNIGCMVDLVGVDNYVSLQVVNQSGQNIVASGNMRIYLKLGVIGD